MKWVFILVAAVMLAGIAFVLRCGDKVLLDAFTVGTYTFVRTENERSTNLPDLIQKGLDLSLQSCGMSTSAWTLLPPTESEWAAAINDLASTNQKAMSLSLLITNRVAGKRLYVRVEPVMNGFEYKLTRPK